MMMRDDDLSLQYAWRRRSQAEVLGPAAAWSKKSSFVMKHLRHRIPMVHDGRACEYLARRFGPA